MKKTIFDVRIPTFFGIFIILIGIAATSFFTQTGVPFISRASTLETPQNIRISNITPTSFTISYTTPGSVIGAISYGETDKMENSSNDDSDENNTVTTKNIHMITVKNLSPQTQYFFRIISGETTFLDNGKPFTIITAPNITNSSKETGKIQGTIIFPNQEKTAQEAIVYIATKDSQTLSAKVDKNFKYNISLRDIRDKTLNNYATIKNDTQITMLVVGHDAQSNVNLRTDQANPVPPIILSKTYDFTINTIPIASPSGIIGFPNLQASPSAIKTPQITNPKKDDSLTDLKPLFRGVASPSANVKIEIHSDEQIKTEIVADKNGAWTFRPTEALSPGEHTVTIKTRDQFGILKTITQSFTVYAQGSQVGQTATPSATLVPNPTISLIPTNTPTPTPTIFPTPTQIPTSTPTPTTIYPPIEPPGNSSFIALVFSAFGAIITGLMLLRLRERFI